MTMSAPPTPPVSLRTVDKGVLPPMVAGVLDVDETLFYWAQPIRPALGIGIWMIFALGPIFGTAGAMAFEEFVGRGVFEATGALSAASIAASLGALLLFLVGLFFLCFPFLAFGSMRRTHALVTDRRVLHIRIPTQRGIRKGNTAKVEEWGPSRCEGVNVVRRRRQSATLVLNEHTEERKSDGRFVYRWEALHGLPRATEARIAVDWMRQIAFHKVHSSYESP